MSERFNPSFVRAEKQGLSAQLSACGADLSPAQKQVLAAYLSSYGTVGKTLLWHVPLAHVGRNLGPNGKGFGW